MDPTTTIMGMTGCRKSSAISDTEEESTGSSSRSSSHHHHNNNNNNRMHNNKRVRTATPEIDDDTSMMMMMSSTNHPLDGAPAPPSPDEVLTQMILQSGATTHTEVVDFCLSSGIPISRMLRLDLMRKLSSSSSSSTMDTSA